MTKPKITRRGFLKLAGTGAASTAVLTGCGPASRYVVREPYANMPEYTDTGESTFYATTCQEGPAGCGIIVRTDQGRAIKIEGNHFHPVSEGKTCARGQAVVQGLYNPDRVMFPTRQQRADHLGQDQLTWEESIQTDADALQNYQPEEHALLMGATHDHLYDLVSQIFTAIGAPEPLRFSAISMFGAVNSLRAATQQSYGADTLPYFDIQNADLVFSFGANFLETWLSPVAYTRQYSQMRKGVIKRGYLIHFEPRMSQTAANADQWFPIKPGTEAQAALALGRLIAEAQGQLPDTYAAVDAAALAEEAGIELEKLQQAADKFILAASPLAIPGGLALSQINGMENAAAVYALNALAVSQGKPNLVLSAPEKALEQAASAGSTLNEIQTLIDRMNAGDVKVLFVHGVNPLFDIPASFEFEQALINVELVISFSSFPDETALAADYILPDHTNLESWGYELIQTGSEAKTISGLQPVVVPFFETRSTADVLLAAVQTVGGDLNQAIPFTDEVAFIQDRLSALLGEDNALIRAGDIKTFAAQFQQYGGWWQETSPEALTPPALTTISVSEPEYQGEGEFFLVPFVSPTLGDKGANKPWLQEAPDPNTTVMWNTWIEINPQTAEELGIHDDDIVRIITPDGEIEAAAYLYPAIRPDTIAIPFGQGHTAYGRYAQGRGANPADLLSTTLNSAGDLVFATTKVKIEKTGKHRQLARLESRIGVYGFEGEH